jgi:hypothetical protein
MSNSIFIILIIVHVLGDYYSQTEKIAKAKEQKFKGVLIHGLQYMITVMLSLLLIRFVATYVTIPSNERLIGYKYVLLGIMILSIIHLCVDCLKWCYQKYIQESLLKKFRLSKRVVDSYVYVLDQASHVLFMLVALKIFTLYIIEIEIVASWDNWIRIFLVLLLIFKPTNVTFGKLFGHIKPPDNFDKDEEIDQTTELVSNNVGRLIGSLERLLVILLLMANQYSAIGFIFAAKSITRFSKISKSQEFAEYYLLGTLFSITATVVVFLIVMKPIL